MRYPLLVPLTLIYPFTQVDPWHQPWWIWGRRPLRNHRDHRWVWDEPQLQWPRYKGRMAPWRAASWQMSCHSCRCSVHLQVILYQLLVKKIISSSEWELQYTRGSAELCKAGLEVQIVCVCYLSFIESIRESSCKDYDIIFVVGLWELSERLGKLLSYIRWSSTWKGRWQTRSKWSYTKAF